jgi:hypothetical protein
LREFFDFVFTYCQTVQYDPAIIFTFAKQNLVYAILIGTVWSDFWALFLHFSTKYGVCVTRNICSEKSRLAIMVSRWIIRARTQKTSYLIYCLLMLVPVVPYIRAGAFTGAQIIGLKSVLLSALFLNLARMLLLYLVILPLL